MTTKQCSKCKTVQPLTEFYKSKRDKSGLRSQCKSCVRGHYYANQERYKAIGRAHYLKEKERNPHISRDRVRRARHGLTPKEWDTWFAANPCCAICGSTDETLHIDHDHTCCPKNRSCDNCRRGALCYRCNIGLGYFREQPDLLHQAIEYLLAHSKGNDLVQEEDARRSGDDLDDLRRRSVRIHG